MSGKHSQARAICFKLTAAFPVVKLLLVMHSLQSPLPPVGADTSYCGTSSSVPMLWVNCGPYSSCKCNICRHWNSFLKQHCSSLCTAILHNNMLHDGIFWQWKEGYNGAASVSMWFRQIIRPHNSVSGRFSCCSSCGTFIPLLEQLAPSIEALCN